MAEKLLKFIRVSSRTYERLKRMGRKGETFNDIIERLLDFWEEQADRTSSIKREKARTV